MSCETVPSSVVKFTRIQIQLPRDATCRANVSVTPMATVSLEGKRDITRPERSVLVETLRIGQSLSYSDVSYANFCSEPAPRSQGLPVEAKRNSAREFTMQPQAHFGAKDDAISRLRALVEEYATDEIITIHPRAVSTAKRFLRILPDGVSLPEFSVEPDGSISLDWIESRNRLFSLSIGPYNRFACAWLDGTNKGYFVENFDGQEIPKRIIDGITAIVK